MKIDYRKYRKLDRNISYRNLHDALFIKNADGCESYYHICDKYQEKAIPVIFKHDIHSYLTIYDNEGNFLYNQFINYCPLCGKNLD